MLQTRMRKNRNISKWTFQQNRTARIATVRLLRKATSSWTATTISRQPIRPAQRELTRKRKWNINGCQSARSCVLARIKWTRSMARYIFIYCNMYIDDAEKFIYRSRKFGARMLTLISQQHGNAADWPKETSSLPLKVKPIGIYLLHTYLCICMHAGSMS